MPHPSESSKCKVLTTTTAVPTTSTKYHASSYVLYTSYSTKSITYTSCHDSHHHTPSPMPTTYPGPSFTYHPTPEGPITVTSTITSWIKCSTPVVEHGTTKYYSTWLTPSFIPTTYITTAPKPTGGAACPPEVTVTETKYAYKTVTATVTAQWQGEHSGNGGYVKPSKGSEGAYPYPSKGHEGGYPHPHPSKGGEGEHPKPSGTGVYPTPSGTGVMPPKGTGDMKPTSAKSSVYYKPTLSAAVHSYSMY